MHSQTCDLWNLTLFSMVPVYTMQCRTSVSFVILVIRLTSVYTISAYHHKSMWIWVSFHVINCHKHVEGWCCFQVLRFPYAVKTDYNVVTKILFSVVLDNHNCILLCILLFACIFLTKQQNFNSLHIDFAILLRCILTPLYHILNYFKKWENVSVLKATKKVISVNYKNTKKSINMKTK